MPNKNTVNGQRAERTKLAETLFVQGYKKWQILDAIQTQFGVAKTTAKDDYARAKQRLRDELDGPKDVHRARVLDMLMNVFRSTGASDRNRIRAAEAYAKLFALNELQTEPVPDKFEIEIPDFDEAIRTARDQGLLLSAGDNGKRLPKKPGGNGSQ